MLFFFFMMFLEVFITSTVFSCSTLINFYFKIEDSFQIYIPLD